MSFGFSPSDVVLLGTTVAHLISRIRSAPARYQEFTSDLLLANAIFSDLNSRLNTHLAGLAVARVHIHSSTIQATFLGIRNSLDELQRRLDDHDNVGTTVRSSFANVKFSKKLDDLRRRLQFHMSSLQLVVQNLSLLQGQRIEKAIRLIRQAQEEQENEDVEEEWNESLDGFANCYLSDLGTARLGRHSTHKSSTSANTTSRDALIDIWLRGIQTAQSTSEAAPGMPESSENLIGIPRSGESSMAASVPPDISIVAEERKSTIVPAVKLTSEPAIAPKVNPKPESVIVQAVEVSQKRELNEEDHRRLLTNTLGVFVILILPMFGAFLLAWILGLVALANHFWAVNKTPTNGTSFQLDYSFANHPSVPSTVALYPVLFCLDVIVCRKLLVVGLTRVRRGREPYDKSPMTPIKTWITALYLGGVLHSAVAITLGIFAINASRKYGESQPRCTDIMACKLEITMGAFNLVAGALSALMLLATSRAKHDFNRVVDIFTASLNANEYSHRPHIHSLSPTAFLPRAADIEPDATAIHHVTANSQTICLTYRDFADRSRGLAYYLRECGHKHVGILCPNTPASIISIFGIAAAGAINTTANCQLNPDEIDHVFDHSEVDAIIVDWEFVRKLARFRENHPKVKIIVDEDNEGSGQFHDAVKEGLQYDEKERRGWDGLKAQPDDEDSLIAVAYTSGTTAKPKGAEYTHRGAYLATIGNIIESGLNYHQGRVRYLWVSHMSHAMGWNFPWAVTAVRGTHYCLRNVDCGQIWGLLKEESITHFNASPAVSKQLCAHPSAELLPDSVHISVAGSSPTLRLFESMTGLNLQPVHIYGLTETYGPVTKGYFMPACNTIPAEDRYKKTVRQRHGFVTSLPIRVIKTGLPEDQIENVKQDGKEIGEIVFVGNVCVKGYHKNPDATRKLFAGGVLHSGDLAVWHDDGSVQILGRQEDIITTGEEKISSVAIESILEEHPDILEAGVIAVPDEVLRERPKAYITIKPGAQISGEALIEWVKRKEIRKVMVPQEVQIVTLLPRTSTGKLKKDDMKKM